MWHGWDPTGRAVLIDLANEYGRLHPGIQIVTRYVPADQLKDEYQTAATAGGGPTILIGPHEWLRDLASAGLIQPLDDLTPATLVQQMNPATIAAVTYQGQLYALPESCQWLVALYYNKGLLGDRESPRTTDDLLTLAADIAPERGYGLGWNTDFYRNSGYLTVLGATLFDKEYTCVLDQGPGTVEFLNLLKSINDAPGVTTEGDLAALFKQEKIAMINDGNWALSDYQIALGQDQVGVVPLPEASHPAAPFLTVESMYISAPATPSQATAAMAFVAYLLAPAQGQVLAERANHVPANLAVDCSANPAIAGLVAQSQTATPLPAVPEMAAVWGPVGDMIHQVLQGKVAPAEAIRAAVQQINVENQHPVSP
ncbi:MAG: extracellular solute-binding protein [Chloroflexi bacterium]|nr:extracellular solute-binding protein [Chloroflexota bacterium]